MLLCSVSTKEYSRTKDDTLVNNDIQKQMVGWWWCLLFLPVEHQPPTHPEPPQIAGPDEQETGE